MSDLLSEIRARHNLHKREHEALAKWNAAPRGEKPGKGRGYFVSDQCGCGHKWCGTDDEWYPVHFHQGQAYEHTLDDVAWLLDALASEQAHAETLIERIDQLHLEVARLRFGKPTPDVAYDIAVRRGSVGGYMGPQSQGPPPPALPPVGVEVVNPLTGERILREVNDA